METDVPSKTAIPTQKRPPLVHTSETTVDFAARASLRAKFALSQRVRQSSAIELYSHLAFGFESRRLEELKRCRKVGWFVRHKETGLVRLALDRCNLRWCALCGSARVSWITWTVSEWLANRDRPKFVTFTIKHSDADLGFQISCLYQFFRNLRLRPEFCAHVRGGIWFFQIKKSDRDGLWHNHFHCVIDSKFYPHEELSSTWCQVTHGSRVVDIRVVRQPGKTANEVARYAACPCDLSKLELEDRVTAYHGLHGRRICGTWGTAKGVPLKPPKDEHPELWENVGSRTVVRELRFSDSKAKAILDAWQNHTVLEAGVNCRLTDDFIENNLAHLRKLEVQNYG
ncbi:hypothetical protein ES708_22086 [subsurface metagenome]